MEWTPKHRTTPRTESLVERLGELAREIDEDLLEAASVDARGEWDILCDTWPDAAAARSGMVTLSDDELDAMIGKVLRFKDILCRMSRRDASVRLAPFAAAA